MNAMMVEPPFTSPASRVTFPPATLMAAQAAYTSGTPSAQHGMKKLHALDCDEIFRIGSLSGTEAAPLFDAQSLLPQGLADFSLDKADRMPRPPDYVADRQIEVLLERIRVLLQTCSDRCRQISSHAVTLSR